MASSEQQRNNNSFNNQSNRNNRTSTENVKLPTREQSKSQNGISSKTQERNNRELKSSFSNERYSKEARRIYNWVMDRIDNLGKSSEYRQEKKNKVIDKLLEFFDKFFSISNNKF